MTKWKIRHYYLQPSEDAIFDSYKDAMHALNELKELLPQNKYELEIVEDGQKEIIDFFINKKRGEKI